MFTGIIEASAVVKDVKQSGSNKTFRLTSAIAPDLKIDQSLAHNGVCLTVEAIDGSEYQVTAVAETLAKTNLGSWQPGESINLERCLRPADRLDGHFVQGHTDTRGIIRSKKNLDGSWLFSIGFPEHFAPLIIEKGSVAVDGISLTAFDVQTDRFSVAIIPYTYQHTNLQQKDAGDAVNLEFDLLGKYIVRWANTQRGGNL